MASVEEAAGSASSLSAIQQAGIEQISREQEITFTKYVRLVLPLDGFVFWVKADLLSRSALLNASAFNSWGYNQPATVITPAATITLKGGLHYASALVQEQDDAYSQNDVIFNTGKGEIQPFNEMGPNVLFIGTIDDIEFAFSRRAALYAAADVYHYRGIAVVPALKSQLIESLDGFDSQSLVVSNSLPIWLSLNKIMPVYPSFLVPDNLVPPFATIHIGETDTTTTQPIPYVDRASSHWQLASDDVRVTIYGLRSNAALDYQDYALDFMNVNDDIMGLQNSPVIRDAKRTQVELGVIAQKKMIQFKVSYYQTRARDIARQMILECIPNITVDGYVPPSPPPIGPWYMPYFLL